MSSTFYHHGDLQTSEFEYPYSHASVIGGCGGRGETQELTNELTKELTNKITNELTNELTNDITENVEKPSALSCFRSKMFKQITVFSMCSLKNVEKALVVLCARSKRVKKQWLYGVFTQYR